MSGAVVSSGSAGRSQNRWSTAGHDDFYVLLEDGRLQLAAAGRRTDAEEPRRRRQLSPFWKIAIRTFITVATLVAMASDVVAIIRRCETWSDAKPCLVLLFLLPMLAGVMWGPTLDCFLNPD